MIIVMASRRGLAAEQDGETSAMVGCARIASRNDARFRHDLGGKHVREAAARGVHGPVSMVAERLG